MDVMVTNCSAHDGSLVRSQQLIDEDGCTIDPAIMSPVVEHPQHGAGEAAPQHSTVTALYLRLHIICAKNSCNAESDSS